MKKNRYHQSKSFNIGFSLYKAGFHTQILVVLIALVLLWTPSFIHIASFESQDFSFFNWVFKWIHLAPFTGVIISMLTIVLSTFILNKTLTDNHIQSSSTIYAAIIFLVFLSNISTIQLSNELISCFFLILSLHSLYAIGEEDFNDHSIFLSSFLVGVAILFYPAIWVCFLLPILAVSVFGTLSIRKILLSLLGTILIWIWVFSIVFFTDSINIFLAFLQDNIQFGFFQFHLPTDWLTFSSWIVKTSLAFPLIIIIFIRSQSDVVMNRRRILVTIFLFGLLLISALCAKDIILHDNLLMIPETIMITYLYEHSKKVKVVGFCIFLIFLLNLLNRWMIVF